MHIHEAKLILLQGLGVPKFAIGEFYESKRLKTGYSKKVFWMSLVTALDLYDKDIEGNIARMNSWGNSISDFSIPLLVETRGEIVGSLGRSEIAYLQHELINLGKEYGLMSSQPDLEKIFDPKKPGVEIFLKLLSDLDLVDSIGNPRKNIKSNEILGLAVALKESHHNFFNSIYTDSQLIKVIQEHLKMPFSPNIKRRGKGYEHFKSEARKLIEKFMQSPKG